MKMRRSLPYRRANLSPGSGCMPVLRPDALPVEPLSKRVEVLRQALKNDPNNQETYRLIALSSEALGQTPKPTPNFKKLSK